MCTYRTDKKARFQNPDFYFGSGVAVPMVSSGTISASLLEGRVFDQSIVGVFPHQSKWTYYLLALFNSRTGNKLIRTINPSTNNSANYIKKIPFVTPSDSELHAVNKHVRKMIDYTMDHGDVHQPTQEAIDAMIDSIYGV